MSLPLSMLSIAFPDRLRENSRDNVIDAASGLCCPSLSNTAPPSMIDVALSLVSLLAT